MSETAAPPADTPADTPSEPATAPAGDWPIRVLALIPLAGVLFLWSDHHLGIGSSQPVAMASLAAALTFAIGILPWFLDEADDKALRSRLRTAVARRVTWRVIAVAYFLCATVMLTWTSVVVLAEDGGRLGRVTLRALDGASATPQAQAPVDKDKPARFILPATPFGRPYRLEVEGYVPKTIDVFPILGVRVRPGTDLRRSPSVLLRFTEIALGSWKDAGGAELRVVAVGAGGTQTLLASSRTPANALFLGRAQAIPADWQATWRTELQARTVGDALAARQLLAWRETGVLPLAAGLEPGQALRVTLTNDQKHVFARSDLVVGKDEVQDQLVGDIE
jgi:hypothetical protein